MVDDEELVIRILSETDPETLDILCYFNNKDASKNIKNVFLGEISRHYQQIKPLIHLGLVQENEPAKSIVIFKDKIDDFVFSDGHCELSPEFHSECREVFKNILRFGSKIPANHRINDQDGKIKEFLLEITRKTYKKIETEAIPNAKNHRDYYRILTRFGYFKEYPPAKSYQLTPIGELIRQELIKRKSSEKIPEEIEFENLLKKLNIFSTNGSESL